MIPIDKPFNLPIDVCGETPVSDIPESYYTGFKGKMLELEEFRYSIELQEKREP